MQNPPKKLLDQVRETIRTEHYSYGTEQTYVDWIKRYILFHHKRHPSEMGAPEIQAFVTYLANSRKSPPPRKMNQTMRSPSSSPKAR